MALNTSMFEQNGQSGYVLKPAVMWDKSHMMYNHFNPMDKEFDGLHATVLTLQVIIATTTKLVGQVQRHPLYNFSRTTDSIYIFYI